ncbi:hypothetical protein D9M68_801360 [compost metagenome]
MQVGDEGLRLCCVVHAPVHVGVHCAGQDRVDTHSVRAKFGGQGLGEADQPGFARGIGGNAWKSTSVADEGRGEDHRASAMLEHLRDLVLGSQKGTGQVDRDGVVPT